MSVYDSMSILTCLEVGKIPNIYVLDFSQEDLCILSNNSHRTGLSHGEFVGSNCNQGKYWLVEQNQTEIKTPYNTFYYFLKITIWARVKKSDMIEEWNISWVDGDIRFKNPQNSFCIVRQRHKVFGLKLLLSKIIVASIPTTGKNN